GHLVGWATQGVLLLNATLTVESGKANSHSGKGWEQVTTGVVEYLGSADRKSGIVFMLWGGSAKVYKKFIDKKKHLVLECAHPSPLSAAKGWFGNGHFTKANEWLKKNGRKSIDWCNLPIAEPKKDK
ncbi:uracil-DNA glycosylase, partial [Ramicandelaber brevisporus]